MNPLTYAGHCPICGGNLEIDSISTPTSVSCDTCFAEQSLNDKEASWSFPHGIEEGSEADMRSLLAEIGYELDESGEVPRARKKTA